MLFEIIFVIFCLVIFIGICGSIWRMIVDDVCCCNLVFSWFINDIGLSLVDFGLKVVGLSVFLLVLLYLVLEIFKLLRE